MKTLSEKFCRTGQAHKNECGVSFYNNVYLTADEYKKHFSDSYYYTIYKMTCDILKKKDSHSLLEAGCGCGTFASMLFSLKYQINYTGFDFSDVSIAMAKKCAPAYSFFCDDIYTTNLFNTVLYDTVVCHEVLEHLQDDISVIRRVKAGSLFIGSVPQFDDISHTRFFTNEEQIRYRYGRCVDIEDILYADRIYLFYGNVKRK